MSSLIFEESNKRFREISKSLEEVKNDSMEEEKPSAEMSFDLADLADHKGLKIMSIIKRFSHKMATFVNEKNFSALENDEESKNAISELWGLRETILDTKLW